MTRPRGVYSSLLDAWGWGVSPEQGWDVSGWDEEGTSSLKELLRTIGKETPAVHPVVVDMGPVENINFDRKGESSLLSPGFDLHSFEDVHEIRDVFELLGLPGHAPVRRSVNNFRKDLASLFRGTGKPMRAWDFQVEREGGSFKLRALLPGFLARGASEDSSPLSVEVLGQTLVVRGSQTEGQVTRSFQRSFYLPDGADADAIQVAYNPVDGRLAIDIPASEEAVVVAAGGVIINGVAPQANGCRTTLEFPLSTRDRDSKHQTLRGSGKSLAEIPWGGFGFWPELQTVPLAELMALEEAIGDAVAAGSEPQKGPKRAAAAAPPAPQAPAGAKLSAAGDPLVVQPKRAQAFWQLVSPGAEGSSAAIEVVTPHGTHPGKPEGGRVPVYTAPQGGYSKAVGEVQLPVIVDDGDCAHAEQTKAHGSVLRCTIPQDLVKKINVKVEL